jgi:hypothetical protein
MWGAHSGERMVSLLQLLLGLASVVILGSLSQIRDLPNLEGQVPVFISPWKRVAQFYPQTLKGCAEFSYVTDKICGRTHMASQLRPYIAYNETGNINSHSNISSSLRKNIQTNSCSFFL